MRSGAISATLFILGMGGGTKMREGRGAILAV